MKVARYSRWRNLRSRVHWKSCHVAAMRFSLINKPLHRLVVYGRTIVSTGSWIAINGHSSLIQRLLASKYFPDHRLCRKFIFKGRFRIRKYCIVKTYLLSLGDSCLWNVEVECYFIERIIKKKIVSQWGIVISSTISRFEARYYICVVSLLYSRRNKSIQLICYLSANLKLHIS